jgi:phosphatidylinositol alpha-1,6-mannosyltransferase
MIRRLSDIRVELVHSLEAYPTGLIGKWLADYLHCKHVITSHGTYGVIWYRLPLDRLFYRRVLMGAARVCPVSRGTAELMRRYFGDVLEERRVRPILNGNNYYQRISSQEVMNRGVPRKGMILTVGDVKPRKGQHISLRAFARVCENISGLEYCLVGSYSENEYFRDLQRIIKTERIENVNFLGAVTDKKLDELYRQASVFVLTPQQVDLQFEGFGLVYLEAGGYGLPVVGADSGGVADAVKDGETGFLVPCGDVKATAEAIRRLLTDENLNRRMGAANRRWSETLTWERCAQEQIGVYRQIWGEN